MAIIGIIMGVIGAAVGIVAGMVGGLMGIVAGLLGACLGLLPVIFPVLLIAVGIIWLVKGSNVRSAAGARPEISSPAPPHGPGNPR
jgi:hypothetical protein